MLASAKRKNVPGPRCSKCGKRFSSERARQKHEMASCPADRQPGQRGSLVCPTCFRRFESSAARCKHALRGCPFAASSETLYRRHASAQPAVPYSPFTWTRSPSAAPGSVDVERHLRRCVDTLDYAGLPELVCDIIRAPGGRNVRAVPLRRNGHVEVFDGEVWNRQAKRDVLMSVVRGSWMILQRYWDANRARLLYDGVSPLPPEQEVSIDIALTQLSQESARAVKATRRYLALLLGAIS
jgi:hypothetical protein